MKLTYFKDIDFLQAIKGLFKELKVPMNYVADEPTTAKEILKDTYKDNATFNLVDDVYFVGMVDDAAFEGNQSLAIEKIKSDYDGILIFGITLRQRENNLLPTRGQLAEISRAFNREFYYTPVVLVFKYKDDTTDYIAFANTERLKYKQAWREGEKAGKVSLLRDINIKKPHRGHEDIINQLKIPTSGKNQVDSFAKLYTFWQEVFSVSILNKKFYQELQNWYFWAIKEVSFPNQPKILDENIDGDETKLKEALKEHKGKNIIRLLTRILFIWFIKEKKLIPEEIFDEQTIADKLINDFTPQKPHGVFATGKHSSKYYRAILQNLFFATLNQEMGKRTFRNDKQHQNVTNLMRYKSYFKNPDYFVQLMEDIVPFMNGGLFECLDKPHPSKKGRQGGDIIIYTDGFSDKDDNFLEVPDYLFFDVDEDVDLSDDFGSKAKVYKNAKTRGLLEILKSYKFTITENTPIEEDVALDPELLGKVFENLLASYNPETKTTARKQTGSFYTPREIVNYMVDESLIAYLKGAVNFQFTNTTEQDMLTFFNPNDEVYIKQGNLPHWTQKDVWFFITFRLADSIPLEKQNQLKFEREQWLLKHKKDDKKSYSKEELKEYFRLFSDRVEDWLNNGYGSCVLKDEKNAKIVGDALLHFNNERYELDKWVVMPNHVHVLVKPLENHQISDILHSWKSFTANEINKNIGKSGQLWMHESYDHIVRNEKAFGAIQNYIRQNPVKAGIVPVASSFGETQSKDALDTMLHQLFSFDSINPFAENPALQKQIIKALDKCTILDPACGSGAFPMGALQKMVHVLHKVDPNGQEWKQRQIDKVNKQIEIAEEIEDSQFRERNIKDLELQKQDIEDAFENNELDYGRKLFLIENCIYGVDIQSIATQISKLRFFISLIVDQKIDKRKPNFGIRPLPNLETKFVAANTLIGIDKPKEGDFTGSLFDNTDVKKLEAQLKKVRHKIFSSKIPKRKRELREEDKKLREQIADLLEEGGMENKTARQLAKWDPYDQNASSPFFDPEWMFDINEGFDVVIGNPPYVFTRDVEFEGDFKKYIEREYFSKVKREKRSKSNQSGKINLFAIFIMKGLFLSKNKGNLTYIVPNNILRTTTYDLVRKYILDNAFINQIVDLGSGVFDNVTASTVILNLENSLLDKKSKIISEIKDISSYDFTIKKISQNQFLSNVSFSFNIYMDEKSLYISNLINKNKNKLKTICRENIEGIVAHKHLIIDSNDSNSFPMIEGKDIKRFNLRPPVNFIIWNKNEIHRTRPDHLWDAKIKIIIQRISGGSKPLVSAVDTNKYKSFASTNNLLLKEEFINQYYFISALINCDVINWYYANNFSNNSTLTVNISKTYMDEIPIVGFNQTVNLLSMIVHYCTFKSNEYYQLERIINAMFFNLYFSDHMKEKEIDVLPFVEKDIEEVMQGRDFEKLKDAEKEEVIEQLHITWSHPDNEVVKRMGMFKEKSPNILKPILES